MSTEVDKQRTFEQRMKDRVRDSIGDLMTDEELSKIVNRTMQNVFFETRRVEEGFRSREEPPFLQDIIKELLEAKVRAAVVEFIKENEAKVLSDLESIIQKGAGQAVLKAVGDMFGRHMSNLQVNIVDQIQGFGR